MNRTDLDHLESEAAHIIREAVFGSPGPVALLFSGGKDSAVVLHLAKKALRSHASSVFLVNIDTGHNFLEVSQFIEKTAANSPMRHRPFLVQDDIDSGAVSIEEGGSRNSAQSVTLRRAIATLGLRTLIGGARRDEEKARAKERVFSVRRSYGGWDPAHQRPELWGLHSPSLGESACEGDNFRVFPLSNWTELDVWRYIERECIELPSIYYSHRRWTVKRGNLVVPIMNGVSDALPGESITQRQVRFRTVGDITCTCPVESTASDNASIIQETLVTLISERGATRSDDATSEASMELRKRQGYF